MTHGYDSVHRTTFLINVLEDSLRCVCRDGRVMTVSYETSELHYIILCQVRDRHHIILCLYTATTSYYARVETLQQTNTIVAG